METQSKVGTGSLRLPIGFRFYPTDQELVLHYLKRKAFNYPLPASIIPELDAVRADPRDLPGDWKEKRYFFGNTKWHGNQRRGRVVASARGYWKPFGKETKVVAPGSSGVVLGFKKSLAFYEGKRLHGTKTPWLMHEFRLVSSKSNPNSTQGIGDWVVYCVFQKKAKCGGDDNGAGLDHFNGGGAGDREVVTVRGDSSGSGPPPPSSSSSSGGVSVVSKNGSDQEESSRPAVGFS